MSAHAQKLTANPTVASASCTEGAGPPRPGALAPAVLPAAPGGSASGRRIAPPRTNVSTGRASCCHVGGPGAADRARRAPSPADELVQPQQPEHVPGRLGHVPQGARLPGLLARPAALDQERDPGRVDERDLAEV